MAKYFPFNNKFSYYNGCLTICSIQNNPVFLQYDYRTDFHTEFQKY